MLWFARASVGLAGFLGKNLVALKNYFPLQFFLILGICIPVPSLCMLCIFGNCREIGNGITSPDRTIDKNCMTNRRN